MPPGHIVLFGLLVLAALLLVNLGPGLQQRLQSSGFADPLSVAYLNAWLKAQPDDARLRLTLAYLQTLQGHLDTAHHTLEPLLGPKGVDRPHHVEAEALELDILSQELWRYQPGSPAFLQLRQAVLAQLDRLAELPLAPQQFEQYANQAIALNAPAQALRCFRRLLETQPYETVHVSTDIAALLLGQGRYREAASTYFLAMERSYTLAEQRRLFTAGLSALQAGNLLPEAMAAAERHGQALADDPDTLRFLARLARSANRPDLAEHYVTRLLYPRPQDRGARI